MSTTPRQRTASGGPSVRTHSPRQPSTPSSPTAAQPAVPVAPPSYIRSYFGEAPWTLHAQPTAWVVVASMTVAMIGTYILRQHVLSTKDHLGVFVLGSYVVFSSYFMCYYFLDKHSTSFRKVTQDKKFYTISNLIKAGILAAITPFGATELYGIVVHDRWNTNTLRNLGCIYAIPDFVSLIMVRRMSYTTILHHLCVCVFNYFSVYNDYSKENVCRLIVVYAAFSTFAYCVNMLLASRFLGVSAKLVRYLSLLALAVYVGCCAINWTWQAAYLRRYIGGPNDHWTVYVYMLLISFVMWDDIVLMRWLLQNVKNQG